MATWETTGAQMSPQHTSPLYAETSVKWTGGINWTAGGAMEPIEVMPAPSDVHAGVTFGLYRRSTGTLAATVGSGGVASWS